MSLLPTCICCDALLRGYNGDCLCERCKEPCPTCGGYVGNCQHALRQAKELIALRDAEVQSDPFFNRKDAA
jgi:hypothetical protein